MPTIQFQLKDLCNLVGQKINLEELEELFTYGKAELEAYDKATDTITLGLQDTNLPYLWSVEGCARLLRGVLGKEKGIPKLKIEKSSDKVIVDKNISKTRPYIAMCRAYGKKADDYLIKQMVQLQEKFCETYGRRRRKASIGIYDYKKVKFPVQYKLADPKKTTFVPLTFNKELNLHQILEQHPTGMKYAFTLEGLKQFPILQDNNGKILSFVPIINSNDLGKVEIGNNDILIEVTGTDEEAVNLGANILAAAFADRGFKIAAVEINYPNRKRTTPHLFQDKMEINLEKTNEMLGITLNQKQIKDLLEKMRYDVKNTTALIPPYRKDILHSVDVVEDIGIMYGYDNIPTLPLTSYTVGSVEPIIKLIDKSREILVGFGFQEVLSSVLSNKELIYDKMNIKDFGSIEIKEYMSQSYAMVRTWIIPMLLDVLSKNKHHDYPQFLFEQGLVSVRKTKKIIDYERLAIVMAGPDVDYTKIRQILDALLNTFNIEYELKETEHDSFIQGRVVRVSVQGKDIAYVGEIHPQVLENLDIQMPTAALEINLTELYEIMKK